MTQLLIFDQEPVRLESGLS